MSQNPTSYKKLEMLEMTTLRQSMVRARIIDLVEGRFVRREGLEPSYVLTKLGQRISRVGLVGTVIDKFNSDDGNYSTITIDDDSASIRIKAFGEDSKVLDKFKLGDMVFVVGKVREYAQEIYVIPEIIKKLSDPNYELFHKLEVLKQILIQKKIFKEIERERKNLENLEDLKTLISRRLEVEPERVEAILETLEEEEPRVEEKKDFKPLILKILEEEDKGEGVEFKKIMEKSGLDESIFEETLNELLSSGICYEPRPGVLKKVE